MSGGAIKTVEHHHYHHQVQAPIGPDFSEWARRFTQTDSGKSLLDHIKSVMLKNNDRQGKHKASVDRRQLGPRVGALCQDYETLVTMKEVLENGTYSTPEALATIQWNPVQAAMMAKLAHLNSAPAPAMSPFGMAGPPPDVSDDDVYS
jgi:hypothetical protein